MPPTALSKKTLGQFFTANALVQQVMCSLVDARSGRALEPSVGGGDLAAALEASRPDLTLEAVELDTRLTPACAAPVTFADFFTWAAGRDGTYRVIFGNPPYVAWKETADSTRRAAADVKARYSDKANLYYLFIDRCVDLLVAGGELVFIVPKEWLYTTSAAPLRNKLAAAGAVTHLIDCGEEQLFADASVPALLIFRFVKGPAQGPVSFAASTADAEDGAFESRRLSKTDTRWMLLPGDLAFADGWGTLGEVIDVKVGMVTGADSIFRLTDPDSVEAETVQWQMTTKRTLEPFLNVNRYDRFADVPAKAAAHLAAHKDALLGRRITRFSEDNWWRYGAVRNEAAMASTRPRVFALAKTRSATPFFVAPNAQYFTGGVLGLFLRDTCELTADEVAALLNSPRYRQVFEAMFLTSANKLSLQPGTLSDVPFPLTRRAFQHFMGSAEAPSAAA